MLRRTSILQMMVGSIRVHLVVVGHMTSILGMLNVLGNTSAGDTNVRELLQIHSRRMLTTCWNECSKHRHRFPRAQMCNLEK